MICPSIRNGKCCIKDRYHKSSHTDGTAFWTDSEQPPQSSSAKSAERVDHPPYYTSHPSGIECIEVAEHMNFNLGNAMKYIWRCDGKGASIQDLEKAVWYIKREIERRMKDVQA